MVAISALRMALLDSPQHRLPADISYEQLITPQRWADVTAGAGVVDEVMHCCNMFAELLPPPVRAAATSKMKLRRFWYKLAHEGLLCGRDQVYTYMLAR